MAVRKQKKCRVCSTNFTPQRPLQTCCSLDCIIENAKRQKLKDIRREQREGRERLKTRRDREKEAQKAFNAYIRERDRDQPCISCGRSTGSKRNAGHYLSVGSHPELRFDETNCHSQCEHCNSWQSGNAVAYRVRLITKIGLEKVEWLEGPHPPACRTLEELIQIRKKYQDMLRLLRERREAA